MLADDHYMTNMQFLAQHSAEAIRQMPAQLAALPMTNVRLMPNERGQVCGAAWSVTEQQWVGLCDIEDPEAQAERSIDAIYTPQVRVFTICGMGLGYAAAALARRLKPYQRLSIWELSPSLYKAMFSCLDVAPLFSDKRVHFFIGPDAPNHIEEHWLTLDVQEKLAIGMPLVGEYVMHVDKEAYEQLLARTSDMLRHHMVGLSTWKMFGATIGDNDLLNIPEYFVTPGYEHLEGLWQDRPAVCIAAGPSLQKNLRQLLVPGMRERVALITAGTTYALMKGLQLEPDFVTTIDFQRLNWTDQFAGIPLDDACPLVYLHSTYPQTVRRWPGPKFVAENGSDTVQWFRKFGEGKKHAAQVQTVAHLNVLVALTLGANPILLLGQDLSMLPTVHHAPGARAQDQAPSEVPSEAFVEVPDYAGHPVHTRHSFLSMKTVFERIATEFPGRLINCSEGGLALTGIPNMPLTDALARCPAVPGGSLAALRERVTRQWQGYTPTIAPELLPALEALEHDVTMLADEWAPALLTHQATRERWEDREPQADLAHDGLGDTARLAMLALEPQLVAHQAAFSLFIIRQFEIIELMATLPAGDAWLTDVALQQRYTADRLATTARLMLGVADDVRHALRETRRRLVDVLGVPTSPTGANAAKADLIHRLILHQHYGRALRELWYVQESDYAIPRTKMRLIGQCLLHMQQYATALAVLGPLHTASGHTQRMQRRLAQFAAETRAVVPAYFEAPHSMQKPTVHPAVMSTDVQLVPVVPETMNGQPSPGYAITHGVPHDRGAHALTMPDGVPLPL